MLTVLRFLWSALLLLLAIYVVAIYITQVGQWGLGMMSTCLAVEVCWWVCRETWRVDLTSMKFFPRRNRWTESCNWDSVSEWVDQSFKKSVAGGIIPSTFFLFPKISPWNLDLWYTGFETFHCWPPMLPQMPMKKIFGFFLQNLLSQTACPRLMAGSDSLPPGKCWSWVFRAGRLTEIMKKCPRIEARSWLGIKEQLLCLGLVTLESIWSGRNGGGWSLAFCLEN